VKGVHVERFQVEIDLRRVGSGRSRIVGGF